MSEIGPFRLLGRAAAVLALLLAAGSAGAGAGFANTGTTTTETFDHSLAGPSVAEMYPSGLEYDAALDRIVVADTGLNRIDVYSTDGTLQFRFGSFGTGLGQLDTPRDVAIDGDSNIYVVDAANDRIQKFDPTGTPLWTAGAGTCGGPCLNTPIGITWDGQNQVALVADTGHSLIKAFRPDGTFAWASPSGSALGIASPRDVTRGPDGRIWLADYHHQQVKAFDVSADGLTWSPTPALTLGDPLTHGIGAGQLNSPYNASFSPDGSTAYVADTGNERIARWDLTTSPPTWLPPIGSRCAVPCPAPPANGANFQQLRRVVVDSTGNLWAADFWGTGIHEFSAAGDPLQELAGAPAPAPGFSEPFGIAVGAAGTTYVVDRLNQRVQRFDSTGTFQNTVGQRGVSLGTYSWPEAAAVAPDGSVWVGDTRNGRLQHYPADLSGRPSVVGSKGTGPNQYDYIHGLAVDSTGVVWAADGANNRIHAYTPASGAHTVFGTVGSGNGQFHDPNGIAVSAPTNRVYVADTGNDRIEELDLAGHFVASYRGTLSGPQGVTLADDGTLWVADTLNSRIVHLSATLVNLGDTFGSQGDGPEGFFQPHSLAVHNNVLYVADTFNNRVQEFALSPGSGIGGGGDGDTFSPQSTISDPAGRAQWYPDGGAVDGSGTVYITDTGNSQIVKVDPDGTRSTLFTGALIHPRGLDIDPDGQHLWVPNTDRSQLVEIDLAGNLIATLGGTSTLHSPYDVAFAPGDSASIYVADTYNRDVVKLDTTSGAVLWRSSTCAGKAMSRTRAISVGDDGSVYVTDTDNNRIVVLDPGDGTCQRAFGVTGAGNGQFLAPRGIVADGNGGLWISDNANYRVQHVRLDGTFIASTTGGFGTGPGQFNAAQHLFMDQGLLAVTDTYNYRVTRFSVGPDGGATYLDSIDGRAPAAGGFDGAWALAYAPNGELFATDWFNHRVQAFKPDGSFDFAFGSYGTRPGQLVYPRGVAVSPDGSTVAVAQEANNISLFNAANGAFLAKVIPADHSGLIRPRQVAFGPDGTLWVADFGHNRVLQMTTTGTVLLSFTNGGTMKAPQGVALDGAGNVYVSEFLGNVVRSYTPTGALIATLATRGSGSTNVSSPAELAIIPAGSGEQLMIADSKNNRVLVLSTSGSPLTSFGTPGTDLGQMNSPNAVAYRPSDGTVAVAEFLNDRVSLWSSSTP